MKKDIQISKSYKEIIMKYSRKIVVIVAIALGFVVLSIDPATGGKGLPDTAKIEEDGSKGERSKNGRWHHQRRPRDGRMIFRGLELTEEQKSEMGEIKEQFRGEVKALYTAHRENMMEVLTSTQQDTMRARMAKFKMYRENRGSWRRERLRRHRGDFPGPVENGVEGAAKAADDKTTWGKVKNLFE